MKTLQTCLRPSHLEFYGCFIVLCGNLFHGIHTSDINSKDINEQNEGSTPREDMLIVHDGVVTSGGTRNLEVKSVRGSEWDTNGYVMFCPCMGRFGNQMEQVTGALAFAKTVNRTMILPPLREDLSGFTPFSDWFQVAPLQEFHRVITGEDFFEKFGDKYWPYEKRRGYCRKLTYDRGLCDFRRGQPMTGFWDYYNVTFSSVVSFDLIDDADLSITSEVKLMRRQWSTQFPGDEHPVLAMYHVPGNFPVHSGNRFIQKYLKWNVKLLAEAHTIKERLFKGEKYLGIHLRVGEDWGRVCELAIGKSSTYFASPQCKSPFNGRIFKEMCYPDLDQILEQTREAIVTFDLQHLYIASDTKPYKEEFQQILEPHNITVHHYNPGSPQMDLIILGEADYFIGNCISTFTSYIKRERDANDRLSTFWGYPI